MARPPSEFTRKATSEEDQRLWRLSRRSRQSATRQRVQTWNDSVSVARKPWRIGHWTATNSGAHAARADAPGLRTAGLGFVRGGNDER